MTATHEELAAASTAEKTALEQALSLSCLVYCSVESETPPLIPGEPDRLPAGYLGRYNDALLGFVDFSNQEALKENPAPEDPEIAWAIIARQELRQLGKFTVEARGLEASRLFSEDAADIQRELYQEMLAAASPDQPN